MEAPEKIYLNQDDGLIWHCRSYKDDLEYIRADAFIEKTCEWLEEHKEAVETEDNGIMGWIPDYFIDDFRKYMKGE